ncbi:MAG: glycolate oxidase subunit GlcE [Gammaproteobacteria bacterium]
MSGDHSQALQTQVKEALAQHKSLRIEGGSSKAFYGHAVGGEPLFTRQHSGIINYEPTELVLTARAGTPLAEIEATLAAQNQMLPFDPPHFGDTATLGGTIACGLSGPRRPYAGAARDYVLGSRVLTGKGDVLHFGGEVMKNVAGYDVTRLMTGALGTLGVLLDISLKVLPRPAAETTLQLHLSAEQAIETMNYWAGQPVPLSAASHDGESLYLRLSGATSAVAQAEKQIGGERIPQAETFWHSVREHTHPFFEDERPLWRLSLAAGHPSLAIEGKTLLDWGGAQRWVISSASPASIRHAVAAAGGHATWFRQHTINAEIFHPLPTPLHQLHQRLKQTFDPAGILNAGRMYTGI